MIRDITIKAVLNGYVVNVGCQTVVFGKQEDLLHSLGEYLTDPEGSEKLYREKAVNAKHTMNTLCEPGIRVNYPTDCGGAVAQACPPPTYPSGHPCRP